MVCTIPPLSTCHMVVLAPWILASEALINLTHMEGVKGPGSGTAGGVSCMGVYSHVGDSGSWAIWQVHIFDRVIDSRDKFRANHRWR